jgi:alpha-glucosidase
MNHVGERPADPLTLLLYPAEGSGESALYEDAGNGFAYEGGEYARRHILCEVLRGTMVLRLAEREGSFTPERELMHLELRAINTRPENVLVNGKEADLHYEEAGGRILVRLPGNPGETIVEVHF